VEDQLRWIPPGRTRGTAVLLHGMMSLGATWWRIGPALCMDGWDVTALDLAGHGAAPPVDGPLTSDVLVERVHAAVPGQVDLLVGHSLGAATAAAAQARRPLARALVLEDPPGARALSASEERARGVEEDVAAVRADRDRILRRSREDNPTWAPEDVEHDVEGIEKAQGEAVAAGLRGGHWRWDLPAYLGGIDVPVLLLAAAGERSALTGGTRDAVRAALPADRFVEMPGGHCLHRDLPDRWLAEVRAFTDQVL
jgi:pimeloyl-ACP methyl ester carboxylesterase